MTIAIGTDIVEIERVANVLARQGEKLSTRILTPLEMERYNRISNQAVKVAFLAKRWSAKEAIAKALGTGIAKGVGWQDMEISNNELGAPEVQLMGIAKSRLSELKAKKVLISMSDEQHYVVAFCTII